MDARNTRIRNATPDDLPTLLEINQAHVPAVSSLTLEQLKQLVGWSLAVRVAWRNEKLVGFMLCLNARQPYTSENYRWFAQRYANFAYIDRIALLPEGRRLGIGSQLYIEAQGYAERERGPLLCEVNTRPRNDASLAFHRALGFLEVGEQQTEGGMKAVAMLMWQRPPHATRRV